MRGFKTYHPIVNFTYFLIVIGVSLFFMHPVFLGLFLCSGVAHGLVLYGKKLWKQVRWVLPLCLGAALLNPLFNHRGITELAFFPSGNPLTLEAVLYGVAAAALLGAVLLHFSCLQAVMTSDKLLYLSGRTLPVLSLIFSMTLRLVPRFAARMREVRTAQKGLGRDGGRLRERMRQAVSALSATVTWALENAADSADSMRARGYGLPGRTTFSVFTFDKRDGGMLLLVILLGLTVLWGGLSGVTRFVYYPIVTAPVFSLSGLPVAAAYGILCFLPVLAAITEAIRWKSLQSKI